MPRKGSVKKRSANPDPVYGNAALSKMINSVMWDGGKSKAEKVVYAALEKGRNASMCRRKRSLKRRLKTSSR